LLLLVQVPPAVGDKVVKPTHIDEPPVILTAGNGFTVIVAVPDHAGIVQPTGQRPKAVN